MLEPGQRLGCLLKKEWTTNVNRNLGNGLTFKIRAFQGDYEVVVRRSGVAVQIVNFTLGATDTEQHIEITTSTEPVTVTETPDYLPVCRSHRAQATLGSTNATTAETTMACHTVVSAVSGKQEGDTTSVTCEAGEVMTGCTSFHGNKEWTRMGERIVFKNDVPVCIAYNGRNSPAGVNAEARCCKVSGLTCDYRVAGPSSAFHGAQAEARCPANTQPLGCSSFSQYPDMDGVYPDMTENSCIAQSGEPAFANPAERSGSIASAACCSAPNLTCFPVMSLNSSLLHSDSVSVTCPTGVMVSCSYWAISGKSAGTTILIDGNTDKCVTYMGANMPAGSSGTRATAVCCTISA